MQLNSKLMLDILDFHPKGKTESLGSLVEKIAEKSSLYSVTDVPLRFSDRFVDSIKSAREMQNYIVALAFVLPGWSSYYTIEKLIEKMWKKASFYNFEGSWKSIGEILSQQDFYRKGLRGVLEPVCSIHSKEDFFGNILFSVYGIIEKELLKLYKEDISYKDPIDQKHDIFYRKPKRKIRRRGYNDKGSLRPQHERISTGPDFSFDEKDLIIKELKQRYAIKVPPRRYWFKSQFPENLRRRSGDGPNGTQSQNLLRKEE